MGDVGCESLIAEAKANGHFREEVRELGYPRDVCATCRIDWPCPDMAQAIEWNAVRAGGPMSTPLQWVQLFGYPRAHVVRPPHPSNLPGKYVSLCGLAYTDREPTPSQSGCRCRQCAKREPVEAT